MNLTIFVRPDVFTGDLPSTVGNSSSEAFLRGPALVRNTVFVGEQKCDPAIEIDEKDRLSIHVYGALEDGRAVGTGRVFQYSETACKIGRLAVMKEFRGLGHGKAILNRIETEAHEHFAFDTILLNAQVIIDCSLLI